jgi:1-acyl-sn-glycerol-3-phosphate acyltransferase
MLNNETARFLYQRFKPEVGRCFKGPGSNTQPWSFWLSAPPEENHDMIKRLGFQLTVKGIEKIPKEGGVVVISNHVTVADPAILIQLFNKARSDQLATCLMAVWHDHDLSQAHPSKLFLVENSKMKPDGFQKVAEVLEEGRVFIIFPSASLAHQAFKSGALRIALDNKVPILPVKIEFQLDWWAPLLRLLNPEMLNSLLMSRSFVLYRQKPMRIVIGDPIPYEELEKYKECMVQTKGGERFDPKVMRELKHKVDSIR